MRKLLGCVLTPVFWLVWLLLLCLFHLAQVIALNLFGARAQQSVVAALNFCLLHTLWLLGVRFFVRFAEPLPTESRPIIIVANHQNQLDIVGIGWYLRRYSPKFVSKIELGKGIPSVSYNLRHSGSALINRSDARQSLTEIGRLGQLIADTNGTAVIFPEGTRARDGVLKPFNSAGIKSLLKKAPDALVIPVYIHQTWALNRYGKFPMSVGERIGWTVLPAIDPRGKNANEVAQLAEESVRREYEAQRNQT